MKCCHCEKELFHTEQVVGVARGFHKKMRDGHKDFLSSDDNFAPSAYHIKCFIEIAGTEFLPAPSPTVDLKDLTVNDLRKQAGLDSIDKTYKYYMDRMETK